MKKRTKRFAAQWALAAQRLAQKLGGVRRDQKQVPHPPSAFKELNLVSRGPQAAKGTLGLPLKDFHLCLFEFELGWCGGRVRMDACVGPDPFQVWGRVTPPLP